METKTKTKKNTFQESVRTYGVALACLVALLAAVYYSIVIHMAGDWYTDPNYSHGFLVPVIAGYFIWRRTDALKAAPVRPSNWGIVVVLAGILMLLFGYMGTEYFTMSSSLIVVLAGTALYLFGKDVLRVLLMPLAYLFFMIPLPYIVYDAFAFPLRLFVTKLSVSALGAMGIVVLGQGCVIKFPTVTLNVANACSGMRSIMSLLALSVAAAFLVRSTGWRRWAIALSALPIAIAANAARIIITGILVQHWGARASEGIFHESVGMAVFAFAMALLITVTATIGRKGR